MKYPLRLVVSYVQPITQHFESRTFPEAPLQSTHTKRNDSTPPILLTDRLKSEVSITLRCWLCSTRYTAMRIKSCLESTSAIKIATMKNMDGFRFKGKPSHAHAKSTPFPVSKDEWDTKEDIGKSMKNALYALRYAKRHLSGRSNVKKSKPVVLAVIELRLSEGISQSVSHLLSQSVSRKFR